MNYNFLMTAIAEQVRMHNDRVLKCMHIALKWVGVPL